MERSCPPSSTTTAAAARTSSSSTTSSNNINNNTSSSSSGSNMDRNTGITTSNPVAIQSTLRQLNKSSYKISKHSGGGDTPNPGHNRPQPPPLPPPAASPPPPPPPPPSQQPQPPPPPPQPQPQPPVYNIHKNDFRDVVQKLTGSPAHHHPRAPSPPAPPKSALPPAAGCGAGSSTGSGSGTSSRLQKIRPPPLAQLTTRSPPALAPAADHKALPQTGGGEASGSAAWARALPLSPLPPFPAVSAAAESPITAYMRCLRSGGVSHQQALIPSPRGGASGGLLLPLAPPSPLAFGCVPTTYPGLLSPGLMFPPSPTPSPKWGDP